MSIGFKFYGKELYQRSHQRHFCAKDISKDHAVCFIRLLETCQPSILGAIWPKYKQPSRGWNIFSLEGNKLYLDATCHYRNEIECLAPFERWLALWGRQGLAQIKELCGLLFPCQYNSSSLVVNHGFHFASMSFDELKTVWDGT